MDSRRTFRVRFTGPDDFSLGDERLKHIHKIRKEN